ncbi:MAG: radical SAM protein [Candidatus Geothermarchaeales archaeon]
MRVLTWFNPFKSRERFQCPPRLCVNVYAGCAYQCRYCYAWAYVPNFHRPRCKPNFKRNLKGDIEKALGRSLKTLMVSISNSTEPLQPLEDEHKHTLYAVERLMEAGFRVILVTKNPLRLLSGEYLEVLDPKKTLIESTVPFLDHRYFEPHAPPPQKRIEGLGELVDAGFEVAARVDPVVPRWGGVPGQSPKEIRGLIGMLAERGVSHVVAKCLRLVGALKNVHPDFYLRLKPFYQGRGVWVGGCYELRDEVKVNLLTPLLEACEGYGITLSTCLDRVSLRGVAPCDLAEERLSAQS